MKDKKIFNFLRFIEALKKGVCLKEFANQLNVSLRTIQRYKKEIEDFFDIKLIKKSNGCYFFPESFNIEKIALNKKDLEDFEKLTSLIVLLNPKLLKFLNVDEKIIKKLANKDIFLIKEPPFEDFYNFNFFQKLKYAIKYNKLIDIEYESDKLYIFKNLKPLKIVFAEGNWYLAVLSDDEINNGFKFLRINFIKNLKEHSKTFKVDKDAIDFLNDFQTLFSLYKEKKFNVIVKVDKEVSRYFRVKKFLNTQNIIEEKDGDLIISYYITNPIEIINLAKRWLPHMKILSPEYIKRDFENMCKEILKDRN